MFGGYSDKTKGYRIFYPSENKVELSRDVIFDELLKYSENMNRTVNSEGETCVNIDSVEADQEEVEDQDMAADNITAEEFQEEADETLLGGDTSDLSSSTIQVIDESFESTSEDAGDVHENQRNLRDRNIIGRPTIEIGIRVVLLVTKEKILYRLHHFHRETGKICLWQKLALL